MRGFSFGRQIDFLVGAPILRLAGWIKPKRSLPQTLKTIGILQTAAIGDTVLMSGAIKDIRLKYPDAKIIIFHGPSNKFAAALVPGIDKTVMIDVFDFVTFVKALRAENLDVLVDFGPWPRINALLSLFSGAACTIGYETPGQHRHYAYDISCEHSNARHELDNQRALAALLTGNDIETEQGRADLHMPEILLPEQASQEVTALRAKPYIVFHPWASGSGKRLKEWPARYWAKLAHWAEAQGHEIIITGAPVDKEDTEQLILEIRKLAGKVAITNGAGAFSLTQCCHVLMGAQAVISVNTGILHMASILGAPVIGLHGPTNKDRWGPVGPNVIAALDGGPGSGYLNLGFEFPDNPDDVMGNLRARHVIEVLEEHFNRKAA